MHISNVLNDKLFVFSGSSQPIDVEKEILFLISERENLGENPKLELISNGENYDSYKLTTNNQFLIKVSLDKETKIFEKESKILQLLEPTKLAPKFISNGEIKFGDKILYSISSFESLNPASEFGNSILFENCDGILKRISSAHSLQCDYSLKDRIAILFESTNFDSQPEFAELIGTSSDNYKILHDEILSLKSWIQDNYSDFYSRGGLVHSSINPSNLLLGAKSLKVVNWENACNAHAFIELSNLRMTFDYTQDFEYKAFNSYNSINQSGSWDDYLSTRKFWAAVFLLDTVFSYIKEIYLYRSLRHDKILKTFYSFCRNLALFEHIPAFQKNKEKLAELFSSPMV